MHALITVRILEQAFLIYNIAFQRLQLFSAETKWVTAGGSEEESQSYLVRVVLIYFAVPLSRAAWLQIRRERESLKQTIMSSFP